MSSCSQSVCYKHSSEKCVDGPGFWLVYSVFIRIKAWRPWLFDIYKFNLIFFFFFNFLCSSVRILILRSWALIVFNLMLAISTCKRSVALVYDGRCSIENRWVGLQRNQEEILRGNLFRGLIRSRNYNILMTLLRWFNRILIWWSITWTMGNPSHNGTFYGSWAYFLNRLKNRNLYYGVIAWSILAFNILYWLKFAVKVLHYILIYKKIQEIFVVFFKVVGVTDSFELSHEDSALPQPVIVLLTGEYFCYRFLVDLFGDSWEIIVCIW